MDSATGVLPRFASKAEFLAWEEQQEPRFEYDGEDVIEVNGGLLDHSAIIFQLNRLLYDRLIGSPFMVWAQVRVETRPGYRYPDLSVGLRRDGGRKRLLADPIVLFEVLPPSTSNADFGRKRVEYRDLPSVRRYVVVEGERVAAQAFVNGELVGLAKGSDAVLALPEIGVTLPLAECYRDVTME